MRGRIVRCLSVRLGGKTLWKELRNMTAIYLFRGDRVLLLYRQGGRVVSDVWTGSAGGYIAFRKTKGEIRQNYYFFADIKEHVDDNLVSNEGLCKWFPLEETCPFRQNISWIISGKPGAARTKPISVPQAPIKGTSWNCRNLDKRQEDLHVFFRNVLNLVERNCGVMI